MGCRYFDAHCDTILKVAQTGGTLAHNPYHVSLERLSVYECASQVFAIFNEGNLNKFEILSLVEMIQKQSGDAFVTDYREVGNKKISALISIEGLGNQPGFTVDDIEEYARSGVKMMSLTWNQDNPLCGGIGENKNGLTHMGKLALDHMDKNNTILDVSHCSERGFWDMAEYWKNPIVATHSNARAVCNHPRNLTDEQLKTIFSSGGMVGINLYPFFLNGTNVANVDDVVRHIAHILSLGGENHIGIGADFDGIEVTMTDVTSADKMPILFERLLHDNYKESFIQRLFYGNFDDFFKKYEFFGKKTCIVD